MGQQLANLRVLGSATTAHVARLPARPLKKQKRSQFAVIIDAMCVTHGVTKAQLRSPTHLRPIVRTRQAVMFLVRWHTTCTLAEIACALGRDHYTTVLHGERMGRQVLKADERGQALLA